MLGDGFGAGVFVVEIKGGPVDRVGLLMRGFAAGFSVGERGLGGGEFGFFGALSRNDAVEKEPPIGN